MRPITGIALAAAAVAIAGCASAMYSQPYALFVSEMYSPTLDLQP